MWVIKSRLRGAIIFLILALLSSVNNLLSQASQAGPTRQSSIDAFSRGSYEEAYANFTALLEKYPKDPLYKYYSGACLVMLKKEPEKALLLLDQSVNGASVVKSLPPDAFFYLGRAQQQCGKFTEAIESYNAYSGEVGKKTAREMGVPGFIQECEDRKGMIAAATTKTVSPSAAPSSQNIPSKPLTEAPANKQAAAAPVATAAAAQAEPGKKTEKDATIQESPLAEEKIVGEREGLPLEYEAMLDEALKLQYKADSISKIAEEQRKQLEKIPEAEKSAMRVTIYQNEMLAASYQKSADSKYADAQSKMNVKQETSARKKDTVSNKTTQQELTKTDKSKAPDSQVPTGQAAVESPAAQKAVGVTSIFEVLPKDAAYPDDKILIDPVVPSGLIYRIQLAVFRNPVPASFFKGITPVYGFRVQGTDKTNYYAGMFRKSADAKRALNQVKETGFKDSFIIALADGKPVSSDRAAMMESEWGSKPFSDTNIPGAVADTVPPALVFRVEVARSMKPLKPDAVEALKTTAGSKGLDIIHLTDGNNVYLIGKFITFESAAEYADLLVRNNYRGARVVAWLGNKEVPVDTARQLFKDLQ